MQEYNIKNLHEFGYFDLYIERIKTVVQFQKRLTFHRTEQKIRIRYLATHRPLLIKLTGDKRAYR